MDKHIFTFILGKKTQCEHKSFAELLETGWVFHYLDPDNKAVMSRDGYFNKFWWE